MTHKLSLGEKEYYFCTFCPLSGIILDGIQGNFLTRLKISESGNRRTDNTMAKRKRKNNDLPNTTQKSKDTTSTKTWG